MTTFNAPVRRAGGEINVYTALLCAAFLILLFGVLVVTFDNIEHSKQKGSGGGPFALVK